MTVLIVSVIVAVFLKLAAQLEQSVRVVAEEVDTSADDDEDGVRNDVYIGRKVAENDERIRFR